MKDLFFITISVAIFSLAPVCAQAQDSTKTDLSANTVKPKTNPKFIENIELDPEAPAPNDYSGSEMVMPAKKETEIITVTKKEDKVSSVNSVSSASDDAYLENCSSLQFKYAILTDQDVELVKDTALYEFIDSWMGTPYMFGGSTKDGVDCSSFTSTLMQQIFKLSIPRTAKEQYDACVRVHKDDLKEGDLVFFNTMGKRHGVSHVGVYIGNNYFVHSSTSSGVMISNLDEDYFSARFVSGGRLN
ncbi:MAG TPA: NlpC/P60 family protein [Ferruginibacter sp.]|jgi:cell wall-associated NlpC family hydrolase|nr:NlpC/P60 family protein [Ferruginibacter sp.]